MPLVAPTPYCTLGDVFDLMSVEGTEVRLDDDNSATGQVIACTANAAENATALQVQPLPIPLSAGSTLDFGGSDMAVVVSVVLSAKAAKGTTSLTVEPLAGDVNNGAVAIDGGVNAVDLARATKAISYATAQVNDYLIPRYQDPAQLATSWTVNRWTTIIACRWLSKRCVRPAPAGLEDDYKEAILEMKEVAAGERQIGDLGTPVAEWPAWSNVIVRPEYWLRKARVQRSISSQGVPNYPQSVDQQSEFAMEL